MLGPKNYPTALQQVNHDADLGKHHRKLEEIHKSNKNREFIDQRIADKERLFEAREKGLKFHNSEKLIAIEKDNELLLGKLVEIARKKKTAADFKAEKHNIGTLNAPSRKREKDRIAAENEAFARRLLSQQPSFNRKKLETDYEKHNSRVKQMQKVPFCSPRKTKLPPLKEEDIRQSKSSHNLKAKSIHSKSQPKSVKNIDSKNEVNFENERIAKEQAELKAQQEKEELERVERELKEAREAREAKEAKEAQEAREAQERQEAQEKAEKAQREKEEQERKEKERIEAEEKQKQQEQQQEEKPEDNSPQEKSQEKVQEKSVADIQKSQNEIKNESVEEKKSADEPQEHKEEVTGMAETKKPE